MIENETDLAKAVLEYRLNLPLPAELDSRKSRFCIFLDEASGDFVTFSYPNAEVPPNMHVHHQIDRESETTAEIVREGKRLWHSKYGTAMPETVAEQCGFSSDMLATCIPYQGPTPLTAAEWKLIEIAPWHVTVADTLLLIEGLGWRPGRPVPEDDEKWIAVWAEDLECGNTLNCYRELLWMSPEPQYADPNWVPLPVQRLRDRLSQLERVDA